MPMDTDTSELTLGVALKRVRLSSGLSQRDLAERLGVDPTYISHLEKDRRDPSVKLLRRVADATGVPASALLAAALWSEMDSAEREPFRPLISSLLRLASTAQVRSGDGA